jgi:hypothetical protein
MFRSASVIPFQKREAFRLLHYSPLVTLATELNSRCY